MSGDCVIVRSDRIESPFKVRKDADDRYTEIENVMIDGRWWRKGEGHCGMRDEDRMLRPGDAIVYRMNEDDCDHVLFVDKIMFDSDFCAMSVFEVGIGRRISDFRWGMMPCFCYFRLATPLEISKAFLALECLKQKMPDFLINEKVGELVRKFPQYGEYAGSNFMTESEILKCF